MNNSVKVTCGINVFNDCNSLKRTLSTTTEYFDRIYVIDGRYPDYNDNSNAKYSTDGTKELVAKYSNCKYIQYFAEQKSKRTRYFKECEYDFLLVIDADEYLVIDSWSTFQDQLQRYILNMPERSRSYQYQINYHSEPEKFIFLPRLIYKPNNLVYANHWAIITDPTLNVENKASMVSSMRVEGITIGTDDLLRPDSRLQQDISYQWNLFLKEKVITDKVHKDTECKANFAKHIVWEVNVWKQHQQEQEAKIKYISRFKKNT